VGRGASARGSRRPGAWARTAFAEALVLFVRCEARGGRRLGRRRCLGQGSGRRRRPCSQPHWAGVAQRVRGGGGGFDTGGGGRSSSPASDAVGGPSILTNSTPSPAHPEAVVPLVRVSSVASASRSGGHPLSLRLQRNRGNGRRGLMPASTSSCFAGPPSLVASAMASRQRLLGI
jgi:hypothetical protein